MLYPVPERLLRGDADAVGGQTQLFIDLRQALVSVDPEGEQRAEQRVRTYRKRRLSLVAISAAPSPIVAFARGFSRVSRPRGPTR